MIYDNEDENSPPTDPLIWNITYYYILNSKLDYPLYLSRTIEYMCVSCSLFLEWFLIMKTRIHPQPIKGRSISISPTLKTRRSFGRRIGAINPSVLAASCMNHWITHCSCYLYRAYLFIIRSIAYRYSLQKMLCRQSRLTGKIKSNYFETNLMFCIWNLRLQ